MCTPASAWQFVAGRSPSEITGLGWKSVGLLELTALPSIGEERWVPWVREVDVLLVDGGDATYLCHWMRLSGWPSSCRRCPKRSGWVSAPEAW
jgi:dipeptidase E